MVLRPGGYCTRPFVRPAQHDHAPFAFRGSLLATDADGLTCHSRRLLFSAIFVSIVKAESFQYDVTGALFGQQKIIGFEVSAFPEIAPYNEYSGSATDTRWTWATTWS
jgi:hypothetical protein